MAIHSRIAVCLLLCAATAGKLTASQHVGQVSFAGVPVPGATVVATQGDQRFVTTTDAAGGYRFADLPDGTWTIEVAMVGFQPARAETVVGAEAPPATFTLTIRPFPEIAKDAAAADTIIAAAPAPAPAAATSGPSAESAPAPPPPADPMDTADGLLINGSVNNGASTPFAQSAAFGNNRAGRRSLYNGMMGVVFGTSAWDSRPFSFSGTEAPRPDYHDIQFMGQFGGPLRIPGLRNRPNFFVGYQNVLDHTANPQSGLVPTAAERAGDFSQSGITLRDPLTGRPFDDNRIPISRMSAAALSLLAYYPRPNVDAARFNYQVPVLGDTRRQSLQTNFAHSINARNSLSGNLAATYTRADYGSLPGFTDHSRNGAAETNITWSHRFSPFLTTRVRYQYTYARSNVDPYFADRVNVSGEAGIVGTDQDPSNWGPPSLSFSNGLIGLSTAQFDKTRSHTHGTGIEALLNRPGHSITLGGLARRSRLTSEGQQNGRGAFTFTGSATGSPFADFLLGLPHASAIAYGNPHKRLTGTLYEAYLTDDWRVSPSLTLNLGVRWEFEGPLIEDDGRLSNLDLTPGLTAATLVSQRRGESLLHADPRGIQPRLGAAWRPLPGSSLVIRAGYGIYRLTNVYRPITLLMAQQPPFSTSQSLERSPATPITLANGFPRGSSQGLTTFAVDPNFRIGDAQNWQLIMQRDLPASLTIVATYLGSYGRNLLQESVPNTYPAGADNPCPGCPSGFVYLTSTGSSVRHAGQFQVRRRLRNGLTATAQYTFAKATDDAGAFSGVALTGTAIAQDWRNLDAERAPSNFDQRHLLTGEVQYTTGVGVTGGGLLTGIRGSLVKGWTISSRFTTGSGLPLTPVYLSTVNGTGISGTLRPSLTGAPIDASSKGLYANPAAFVAPGTGTWGDAGRNSLRGPRQFEMSAGLARSFEWGQRATIDWRLDATNVLNRVTFSTINTIVGSPQFGAPTKANAMRKLQTSVRFRF